MTRNVRVRKSGNPAPVSVERFLPGALGTGAPGTLSRLVGGSVSRSLSGVFATSAAGVLSRAISGENSNASRIAAILNGREPHFAWEQYIPADPVTTDDVTVTTAAGFNSAAATGARIIRVNTSFTGNVAITGDDVDVIMSNSATITGNLELGTGSVSRASRVRWTGGNINGRLIGRQFEDVLFDDVNLNSGASDNTLSGNSNRFDRIAFLNSTLENSPPAGSGSSWVLFNQQIYTGPTHTGFIWLNSKAISTALHAFRLMSITGLIVADSVFNPNGTAGSAFRTHIRCIDVWLKDSWFRGRWHANRVDAGDPAHVTNLLADGFDGYVTAGFGYVLDAPTDFPNTGEVRNSTYHSADGAGSGSFTLAQMTYGTGNSRVGWNGSTVPDYATVGAIR